MSLRLPPKVRERMRPTRSVISRCGGGPGTILQRRSCNRQSIRRHGGVLPICNDDDDNAAMMMMMCLDGHALGPDDAKDLRNLLDMPGDYEFSSLDLMTFGDLDEASMADYIGVRRRFGDAERVGVDFPRSKDVRRAMEALDAGKEGNDADTGNGASFVFKGGIGSIAGATVVKDEGDTEGDVEIIFVGRGSRINDEAVPMKAETGETYTLPNLPLVDADSDHAKNSHALASVSDNDDAVPAKVENFAQRAIEMRGAAVGDVATRENRDVAAATDDHYLASMDSANDAVAASVTPATRRFATIAAPLLPLSALEIPKSPSSFLPSDSSFAEMLLATKITPTPSLDNDDDNHGSRKSSTSSVASDLSPSSPIHKEAVAFGDETSASALTSLKKASVKIGGAQYRLVLPNEDFGNDKNGFDAIASAPVRASTPVSAATLPFSVDASFAAPPDGTAVTAAISTLSPIRAVTPVPVEKAELDAAEWSRPIDGWKLKRIETLMNSKTLKKYRRKSKNSSNYSNIPAASSVDSNKQPEIILPGSGAAAAKKIFIVFPDSKDAASAVAVGKKDLKFVLKTKINKKAIKVPKHSLRKCGEGPSPPKMFSKAAVQRNVLYMKNGDKLGYKKMKKMSSCPEMGRCCSCPLKNNQSICHPDFVAKEVK